MATNTTKLSLLKPSENDFYNQQTEQSDNWEKVDKFADDVQKNVDFNLLATLGIGYGGILNNTEAKIAGKAYYDTTGKKLYKCIANTSLNYADAEFFEAISNNDLLDKANKLININGEYKNIEIRTFMFNMPQPTSDVKLPVPFSNGIISCMITDATNDPDSIFLHGVDLAFCDKNKIRVVTNKTGQSAYAFLIGY